MKTHKVTIIHRCYVNGKPAPVGKVLVVDKKVAQLLVGQGKAVQGGADSPASKGKGSK